MIQRFLWCLLLLLSSPSATAYCIILVVLADEDIPNIPLIRANGPLLIVALFVGAVIEEAVCVCCDEELIIIGALAFALPPSAGTVFWLAYWFEAGEWTISSSPSFVLSSDTCDDSTTSDLDPSTSAWDWSSSFPSLSTSSLWAVTSPSSATCSSDSAPLD